MSDEREMTLREWCAKLPACHLVNRELRELEAEVARLKERHRQAMHEQALSWCDSTTVWANRAEAAEAKLRAVGELPEKWRRRCMPNFVGWKMLDHRFICADELEALLKEGA